MFSLNLHPHVHALASREGWSTDGNFEVIIVLDAPPTCAIVPTAKKPTTIFLPSQQ
jgi:hypothetical protein